MAHGILRYCLTILRSGLSLYLFCVPTRRPAQSHDPLPCCISDRTSPFFVRSIYVHTCTYMFLCPTSIPQRVSSTLYHDLINLFLSGTTTFVFVVVLHHFPSTVVHTILRGVSAYGHIHVKQVRESREDVVTKSYVEGDTADTVAGAFQHRSYLCVPLFLFDLIFEFGQSGLCNVNYLSLSHFFFFVFLFFDSSVSISSIFGAHVSQFPCNDLCLPLFSPTCQGPFSSTLIMCGHEQNHLGNPRTEQALEKRQGRNSVRQEGHTYMGSTHKRQAAQGSRRMLGDLHVQQLAVGKGPSPDDAHGKASSKTSPFRLRNLQKIWLGCSTVTLVLAVTARRSGHSCPLTPASCIQTPCLPFLLPGEWKKKQPHHHDNRQHIRLKTTLDKKTL